MYGCPINLYDIWLIIAFVPSLQTYNHLCISPTHLNSIDSASNILCPHIFSERAIWKVVTLIAYFNCRLKLVVAVFIRVLPFLHGNIPVSTLVGIISPRLFFRHKVIKLHNNHNDYHDFDKLTCILIDSSSFNLYEMAIIESVLIRVNDFAPVVYYAFISVIV